MKKLFLTTICLWALLPHICLAQSDKYEFLYEQTVKEITEEHKLNFRLPYDTYPEHYHLILSTNVHKGEKKFQGQVTINIKVINATKAIVLHALELDIKSVFIENVYNGEVQELFYEYKLEREFLIMKRQNTQEFPADTKWKLTIIYSGELRDDQTGFYIEKYSDSKGNNHYFAATQFESTYARYAFPCYDEPNKRANFTITIKHSQLYTAISSMPINRNLSSKDTSVFLTATHVPPYALGFVISDFVYTELKVNGLSQRVYSRATSKNTHKFALESAIAIAQLLSDSYGTEFMFSKIDHVALPDSANFDNNNLGLITYPEENLLFNESTSKVQDQHIISLDVAKKVTNQLLENCVTLEWWNYLWLKKGFETLYAFKSLNQLHPEWNMWADFHGIVYENLMKYDNAGPLNSDILLTTEVQISNLYATTLADKAAVVLFMWNSALTDKVFQTGFHNFLMNNRYKSVTDEQLFEALQAAAEEQNYKIPVHINKMFDTWTRQTGYPILTVTRNYNNGTFSLKQAGYDLNDRSIQDSKTWYVPINYVVASNPDFSETAASHYILNVTEVTFDNVYIPQSDWLLLNKQSTGFYRINYDIENWYLIIESLQENPFVIHSRNRAKLLSDAYHFVSTRRLDHAILLNLLTYLKQESQINAWHAAVLILQELKMHFSNHENFNEFKYFVADVVRPMYKKFGVTENSHDSHNDKLTRNNVAYLACMAGVKECLQETYQKLWHHLYKNATIEPNLLDTIYAFGLSNCSDEMFNQVYQKLMDATDSKLRSELIIYLAYSQNENHIKKFIRSSIDMSNNLWPEERYTLLQKVYIKGGANLLACIEFLEENWDAYGNLQKYSNPLYDDIIGIAEKVSSKKVARKLMRLVNKVENSKHVGAFMPIIVANKIMDNEEWHHFHAKPIMKWIKEYNDHKRRKRLNKQTKM